MVSQRWQFHLDCIDKTKLFPNISNHSRLRAFKFAFFGGYALLRPFFCHVLPPAAATTSFLVPKQCFHARVWKGLQSPEGFALKLLGGYGHDMSWLYYWKLGISNAYCTSEVRVSPNVLTHLSPCFWITSLNLQPGSRMSEKLACNQSSPRTCGQSWTKHALRVANGIVLHVAVWANYLLLVSMHVYHKCLFTCVRRLLIRLLIATKRFLSLSNACHCGARNDLCSMCSLENCYEIHCKDSKWIRSSDQKPTIAVNVNCLQAGAARGKSICKS